MEFRFDDPARDFSDGLEVLRCYHRAFLKIGEDLLELAREIRREGMNEARANRCVEFHCFYTRANLLHHRDEELALFPALAGQRSPLLDGMVERLALDHEEIEEAWEVLARHLGRPEHLADGARLLSCAREFEVLQREHLEREDSDFLPRVEALLDGGQRAAIGRTMLGLRRATAGQLRAQSMV